MNESRLSKFAHINASREMMNFSHATIQKDPSKNSLRYNKQAFQALDSSLRIKNFQTTTYGGGMTLNQTVIDPRRTTTLMMKRKKNLSGDYSRNKQSDYGGSLETSLFREKLLLNN